MDSDLRQEFGLRLRDHLRQKHLHQSKLANALHMTPSAVSQILRGKFVPTQPVFDRILEFLALPCDETEKLQSMLLGIRSGMHRMHSPLNRRIFALRCQSGYSLAAIEQQCGISPERMNQLENISSAVPTAAEREKLTQLFDAELRSAEHCYGKRGPTPVFEVADRGKAYSRECREDGRCEAYITLLSPADFADFRAGDNLGEYVEGRNQNFVAAEYAPEWVCPVAVQGCSEAFHLKSRGRVRVIVTEAGSIGKPDFVFCGDGKGNCFLRGGSRAAGVQFVADRRFKAAWRLPVVDVSFRPDRKIVNREVGE